MYSPSLSPLLRAHAGCHAGRRRTTRRPRPGRSPGLTAHFPRSSRAEPSKSIRRPRSRKMWSRSPPAVSMADKTMWPGRTGTMPRRPTQCLSGWPASRSIRASCTFESDQAQSWLASHPTLPRPSGRLHRFANGFSRRLFRSSAHA